MRGSKKINYFLNSLLGVTINKSTKKSKNSNRKSIEKFNLKEYLKELDKAFNDCVDVPGFLSVIKPTPINFKVNGSFRALKFNLPEKEALLLHSVSIIGIKNKHIPTKDITIITSSAHVEDVYSVNMRKKALFNTSGPHRFAFFTAREDNPWMILILPEKTYIDRITINNVSGLHATRAVGLTVSATTDLKKWNTLYSLGGIDNFLNKASEIASKYKILNYYYGKTLYKYTCSLVRGYDNNLKSIFAKFPDEYKDTVQTTVNNTVLSKRKIEWTSHGIRQSFRFYSRKSKQEYIQKSMSVINDLKELSTDVCLGFGSVLAVVRDKDLIPHDDDMDIIIGFKPQQASTIKQGLKILAEFLINRGYIIRKIGYNHCFVVKDGLKIDVFVGIYDADNTIGWFPGKRNILNYSDVFPARNEIILGINVEIPKNPEIYLESIYGKNWNIPIPNYHHSWADKSQYSDIYE